MTWFDWLFIIIMGLVSIASVFCWIYTIYNLLKNGKTE